MIFRIFEHPRVRQLLTITLLSGTLLCMFPPQHPAFQWWADHAFAIAVGYLLLGLFFLIINKPKLLFVCLGCSAAISFFKNESPSTTTLSEQSFFVPASRETGGTTAPGEAVFKIPSEIEASTPQDEPSQKNQ